MDSHTLVKEISRLLVENKNKIIKFTILFFSILLVVQFIPAVSRYYKESKNEGEVTTDFDNPAIFEMYIEYENGNVYTNTLLLEETLKSESNIQAAEEATGVEISDLLDLEEELGYKKTATDRGALGATRNELSNIWIFIARVGTEEENLRVSEYFYDLILNNNVEILNNKPFYSLSEPRVFTQEELIKSNILLDGEQGVEVLTTRFVISTVIFSLFGGIALAFILVLTLTFFNKKISFAFNYHWSEEDTFILLENNQRKSIERALLLTKRMDRVLLLQDKGGLMGLNLKSNNQVTDDLLAIDLAVDVEEVVIFIQPGKTEKNWYNQQREILKVYRVPVKIIQVNGAP